MAMNVDEFLKKIQEYEHLHNFPPFSIKRKTDRFNFANEFMNADSTADDPWADLEKDWSEQLAEARMYSQRYGKDWEGARNAAAKLAGIDVDDNPDFQVLQSPDGLNA